MRRAALMGPRNIVLQEVDIPKPSPTQVLVRVHYNGICGSELPPYLGLCTGYPYYARKLDYPISSYGHEGVGHVVDKGSEVTDFEIGDRVVGSGGYAEYVVAEAAVLTKVPEEVSDRHAALCKMAQEAAWVLERMKVTAADRVLITGMGSAGLLILEHLREAGCNEIVCVDKVQERLEVASSLGATTVLRADDQNLIEKIKAVTSGGPSIAIDTSGITAAIVTCFETVEKFGQVGLFGRPHDDIENFRIEHIMHKMLTVYGLKCPPETYTRPRTIATLRRIQRKVIHADSIITHEFPLDQINEAFEAAVNHVGLKILVRCN